MKPILTLMAIGDAFGMRYEFIDHDCTIWKADLHFGPNANYAAYKPAHYTDDTQMALANAELLLKSRGLPTEDDFINAWLTAYKRDPRPGYSRHMQKVLSTAKTPDEFRAAINPSGRTSSGAAMRAGPIGLLADVQDVYKLAELQARITHDSDEAVLSAKSVALTVHFLHHGGRRGWLPAFLRQQLGPDWDKNINPAPENGINIVRQSLDVLLKSTSQSGILINAVNHARVSDTDTICALAMLFASRCPDIMEDLQTTRLHGALENGNFGLLWLEHLDRRLESELPSYPVYTHIPHVNKGPSP